jgi:hypothetical protein
LLPGVTEILAFPGKVFFCKCHATGVVEAWYLLYPEPMIYSSVCNDSMGVPYENGGQTV